VTVAVSLSVRAGRTGVLAAEFRPKTFARRCIESWRMRLGAVSMARASTATAAECLTGRRLFLRIVFRLNGDADTAASAAAAGFDSAGCVGSRSRASPASLSTGMDRAWSEESSRAAS
jgi:hypothetical protein